MESCVYEGRLTHLRYAPRYRFEMRLFALYLDLAEIEARMLDRMPLSTSRPAPLRFRRRDYPGDPAIPLATSIRDTVARALGTRPSGAIRLLTQPRVFGYAFNPVSFFYCFDTAGRLEAIVADVTNTPWNERHSYVLPAGEPQGGLVHARQVKTLHVSPFMPMDLSHEFTLRTPCERLDVHIADTRGDRRLFEASLAMTRRKLTRAELARVLARYPFLGFQVTARIYWHALRLRCNGARFFPHPTHEADRDLSVSPACEGRQT